MKLSEQPEQGSNTSLSTTLLIVITIHLHPSQQHVKATNTYGKPYVS